MNNTEPNRSSIWLTVIATMALFRMLLIPLTFIASVIDMFLGRSWLIVAQQIRYSLPVVTPVITVGVSVAAFYKLQPHIEGLPKIKKLFIFTVLTVIAIFPWQPEVAIRMTPVSVDDWRQMQGTETHDLGAD